MSTSTVKFTVTFHVDGLVDVFLLKEAILSGIYEADDQGYLTPDDGSGEITSYSVRHEGTVEE